MLSAILFLVPALACFSALELFLYRAAANDTALEWGLEHIYLPLLRILLLLGFIALAYPDILNAPNAPSLKTVIDADTHRLSHWVNLAFIAGLVLPLVPALGRLPAPLFSLQALLAVTLLFCWTADAMQIDVSPWPGHRIFLVYLLISVGSYICFRRVMTLFFQQNHLQDPIQQSILDTILILSQIPAIWFFARGLGQQLA